MTALDFIMYCTGIAIVAISIGLAVRLVSSVGRRQKRSVINDNGRVYEPVSDPNGEGLVKRMLDFQTARYSSPIVKRTLDKDAGPQPRQFIQHSQPTPFRRQSKQSNKVDQFPQKIKTQFTKKEE